MNTLKLAAVLALAVSLPATHSFAAVTAEEANELKTTLTPLGAEKAGNKDGTIPVWQGGYTKPIPGSGNGKYPDPFPEEKPIAQITSKNAAQYGVKLSEGTLALLNKYPSYRIDVYPTHRTAGAPQWIYDNTFKAATQATLTKDGLSFTGAWGGVPFPIPKTGNEIIINHLVRPRNPSSDTVFDVFVGSSNGTRSLASRGVLGEQVCFYQKGETEEKCRGNHTYLKVTTTAPAFKAGEAIIAHDSFDMSIEPQVWQYMVGQRRVRRAPTVSYDTPDFMVSGASYFDEVSGLRSRIDRYNWKLVGKEELYVPYNNNRFFSVGEDKAFVPFHTNPDAVRWELHRVWVVEATVANGKRHAVPKRRFYVDEDSWAVLLVDGYDAQGKLWRASQVMNEVLPETGGMLGTNFTAVYNLQASTYAAIQYVDQMKVMAPRPLSYFSPEALANDTSR